MRKSLAVAIFVLLLCVESSAAGITLPKSRRLAGPLDTLKSEFGDEFFNFPAVFGGRAAPGHTYLSGWIEIQFDEPSGNLAEFKLIFLAVGTDEHIEFPGGPAYDLKQERVFNAPGSVSRGKVNLSTGEISDLEVHATFQNSLISRVCRGVRIPFGFGNDYPPLDLPVPLPFSDRPPVYQNARFSTNSAGSITGFEMKGESIAPVTVLAKLGVFPSYSFNEESSFYFALPTGCKAGTSPRNCPDETTDPGGLRLPDNAFFHPHLFLVSSGLREVTPGAAGVPGEPVGLAGGVLVAAGGLLYHAGGFDGNGATGRLQAFDPSAERWSNGPPMLRPLSGVQGGSIGGQVYIAGGMDAGVPAADLQVYDPAADTWTAGAPMPRAVASAAAAVVGDKLYIINGAAVGQDGTLAPGRSLQVYDSVTHRWSLESETPLATAGSSAVSVGSRIYLMGGATDAVSTTRRVFIYDTQDGSWREGPPLLRAVTEASGALAGGFICLVGGRQTPDGAADGGRMQLLDPSRGAWRDGIEPPFATAAGGAAVLDDTLYVAGGFTMSATDQAPGTVTRAFQAYDPARGWKISGDVPLFTAADVVGAGAGVAGPGDLSPGARIVILGKNLAGRNRSAPLLWFKDGFLTSVLPTTLEGVRVLIDGTPAPLESVGPERIELQVPNGVTAAPGERRMVPMQLLRDDIETVPPPVSLPLAAVAPSIYVHSFREYRERAYLQGNAAIARNTDGRLNHPASPAHPGDVISLRVTGLGLLTPSVQDGVRARQVSTVAPVFPVSVLIGGKEARVVSCSAALGEAGIFNLGVEVPADSPRNINVSVVATVQGVRSNQASISIR